MREFAGSPTGGCPDVVILDPSRRGAGCEVIETIDTLKIGRTIPVARGPATSARDLGTLLRSGYAPGSMNALDMSPHAHRFKTITVLGCS